jgi:translation initiation factor eIF-2B subunit beta
VQQRLDLAQPIEYATTSTSKRILHIIMEETMEFRKGQDSDSEEKSFRDEIRPMVVQGIQEMMDEMETSSGNIAQQALEHIHSNEIIMTIGWSKVVVDFLKEAARFRKFQVIVAETAPEFKGHEMAKQLSSAGIETTVITDSAIFAVMSRVNKVILGTHAGRIN